MSISEIAAPGDWRQTAYRILAWLGRGFIGDAGVLVMTKVWGSSNAQAKRVLSWQPNLCELA
jgi:hypothetical protein